MKELRSKTSDTNKQQKQNFDKMPEKKTKDKNKTPQMYGDVVDKVAYRMTGMDRSTITEKEAYDDMRREAKKQAIVSEQNDISSAEQNENSNPDKSSRKLPESFERTLKEYEALHGEQSDSDFELAE